MIDVQSPRLKRLQIDLAMAAHTALEEFWLEINGLGTPLIERQGEHECYVTFVWRGDDTTRGVDVIQDWGADGIREHSMQLLPETNVWFNTRIMKSDTRTTYQLAPDPLPKSHEGQVPFMPDPLNPRQFVPFFDESGFRIHFSLLELSDAPKPAWVHSETAGKNVQLHKPFEDQRRIWVYQPHTAYSNDTVEHSLLIMFDGRLAKDILDLPSMLETRLAEQSIPPTIVLMIDNEDRDELACNEAFAAYIAERVIPWARATFPVSGRREQTVVAGSSLGGLCAAFIALRYPHRVGHVMSQTGWFRWYPEGAEPVWLAREVIALPFEPVEFYMDVGNLECARMLDGGPSQLDANRHMRDTLRAKGYQVVYREFSGGHDYSSIQMPLYDALPLASI